MSSSKKKAASSSSDPAQEIETPTADNAAISKRDGEADAIASASADVPTSMPQPIPPPSEPLQFRAIGLLQGVYVPSEEQFNRGELVTREGLRLDAVLLGQVMSLVKKYLDLSLPHLWVVYPRTRDEEPMHVQLVGVWSPEGFEAQSEEAETKDGAEVLQASLSPLESLQPPLKDGFFSVRGQVMQQNVEDSVIFVKIQQSSRKKKQTAKAFKVKLSGDIAQKPMGYFWDFEVVRDGDALKIEKATPVAFIPVKRKKSGGARRKPETPHKPIPKKKEVPLGSAHGKPEPKFTPPAPKKKSAPVPSRPLPKIIKPEDS